MNQLKEQLKEILTQLPERLRQYITNGDWENKLRAILVAENLAEEQNVEIIDEVLLVLLGITDPDDLPLALRTVAELSKEQSERLAKEFSDKILSSLEDELLELNPISIDDYRSGLPEINSALAKLPKVLQEVITSADTENKIQTIGQKYQLHIDQIGTLDEEVNNVLFGISPTNELVQKIKERLGLDQTTTDAIAREVNEQIFLKIRESLQALHNEPIATDSNYGVEMLPSTNAPATAGGVPDKEEVIDGIENPAKTPEDSVFEQKMGKLFRIPREEVDLDPYLEKPK